MRAFPSRNAVALCLTLVALAAVAANAQMTATPSSVSAFPTQTTPAVSVNLTFTGGAKVGGTGTIGVAGLPAGVTTVPSPVTYTTTAGATSASTTLQFSVGSTTTPGSYAITLRDGTNGAGATTVTLVVNTPSITASASPNPVTLTVGGASQPVTVSTTGDPGFNGSVTYTFSGFPAFIINDGPKSTSSANGLGPVTFNFSLGTGATGGTYNGTLNAQAATGAPIKSFAFAVVVPPPDITAVFTQPTVAVCNGQTANDSVQLTPVNGYSGSPTLTFTSVPAGITISPITGLKLPPATTAPFTITANGATSGIATLNISDPAFGINKNIQLQINVTNPDFTPAVTPNTVTIGAGGAGQALSVSITPNACLNTSINVSASGMPAGMTLTPSTATIAAPSFAPVSMTLQATSAVFPGTYPITFSFNLAGVSKTVTVQATVQQPDIQASFAQPSLAICNGQSASNTIQLTPVNGYSGTPSLSFTSVPPGITISPSPLPGVKMPPSASIPITVSANGASSGTIVLNVSDPAFGINKTVSLPVSVTNPDFTPATAPLSLSLTAGGSSQNVSASVTPNGCLTASVSVAASGMPAGMTVTPSPASIASPAFAPVSIAFQASTSTIPGTYAVTLTYNAGTITKTQTVSVSVNAAPDFVLALNPASLTLQAGSSGATTATITAVNGFSGTATVTAPSSPGVTITPATFTLAPGASQPVTIDVAATATPGTRALAFTATAPGISGTRSATLSLAITAGPDFSIAVNPGSANVAPGASVPATVVANAFNGFTSTVSVVAPTVAGVTITPSTFSVTPGTGGQPITITVAPTVTPGTIILNFTGTSPTVTGTKTATMTLTVTSGADFSLVANPPSLSAAAGGAAVTTTISVNALNGFAGVVSVAASSVPGVTVTPSSFTIAPGAAGQVVSITTASGVAPQTLQLTFTGTSPSITGARTVTVPLSVTAPPGFILALAPSSVTIPAGGSTTVTASIVPLNGFSGTVTVTAPNAAGLTFNPATFTLTVGSTQVVTISADPNAPAGDRGQQSFTASAPGITNATGATVAVVVSARPDFTITADPPSLSIRSGQSANVTLSAGSVNGFAGAINVTAPTVPGLTFSPASFTFAPGATQVVAIAASPAALGHGPIQVTFAATGTAPAGSHGANVIVTVLAPPPLLTASVPSAVVAGAQSVILRVSGENLQAGARFASSDPSLIVEAANVLTAQLADVRVSVRNDAKPGPRDLTATNPDGGVSGPLVLLVYPPGSIAAPLDVTAAAIVFPARGTMISSQEAVYPRGLLATSGTGTIIGSWQFDGVPFDRFVVNANGGMPVEVRTNIALPASFNGSHTITMVIEQPRHFVSPSIDILNSADSVSRLTLLAPHEGAIIKGAGQTFRWSIVPNCSGYDVEVAPPGDGNVPDALVPIKKFHVADAEWHPGAADFADIGPGIHRWRIRPRCAGETGLQPSAWQRFAILPDHVTITMLPSTTNERGARVVRWSGGIPGLLYRVEFLSPDGQVVFSALTSASEYALPQALPAGTTVRVSAIGPDGKILGTSTPANMTRRSGAEAYRYVQQALVEIVAVEPADGSTINTAQPHIAAQWKGAAKPDEVTLLVDNTDITQVATVTTTSVAYDSLIALTPGTHTAALAVAGNVKRWTFNVAPPPVTAEAAAPAEPRGDWVLAPVGTVTLIHAETQQVRTELSALTDLNAAGLSNKVTGDVALNHDLKQDTTRQESRNWAGEVGSHQGDTAKERLRFGYVPPDFLDQAQFLTAALPRGGIQASLVLPKATASYYQTFQALPAGLTTGLFGPSQKIRAAALQTPITEKWDLRVFGLRVEEGATETAAGGTGHAVGFFGRYTLGATISAIVEAAHGDFKPSEGSTETERKGNAFRASVTGMKGTVTYAVNVRKTDADFVNPANRGFTPGGVPDRTAADVMVGKSIGTTALSVQLRHQFDGSTTGLSVPRTRESGGTASLTMMLGAHVSAALSGNLTKDTGDAKEELAMPRSDRTQSGQTATLSEFFGVYNFSQTLTRQLMRDHVSSLNDNTVTSATLSGGGQLRPWFNLSTALSATNSEGSAIVGTTKQYLASLQPIIMIPTWFLSFQPRASYSTSESDLVDQKTTSEQYAAMVTFGPTWFNQIVALQLSADWNRSKVSGQPAPGFTHRYVATVNLHWRAGYGPAYTSGVMPPGVGQVAAPNPAASAPGGH